MDGFRPSMPRPEAGLDLPKLPVRLGQNGTKSLFGQLPSISAARSQAVSLPSPPLPHTTPPHTHPHHLSSPFVHQRPPPSRLLGGLWWESGLHNGHFPKMSFRGGPKVTCVPSWRTKKKMSVQLSEPDSPGDPLGVGRCGQTGWGSQWLLPSQG